MYLYYHYWSFRLGRLSKVSINYFGLLKYSRGVNPHIQAPLERLLSIILFYWLQYFIRVISTYLNIKTGKLNK